MQRTAKQQQEGAAQTAPVRAHKSRLSSDTRFILTPQGRAALDAAQQQNATEKGGR